MERAKKTIERTLLPNLNSNADRLNRTDLQYFYKIKRNLILEEWQHQKDSPIANNKNNQDTHRFSISPRLRLLSKHKPAPRTERSRGRQSTNSFYERRLCNKKQQIFNENYFNQNHFFFVKQDGLEYTEEDNLGKNINGTTLGIFSQQVISQKLQNSRQKQIKRVRKPPATSKELDSDSEVVETKQLQTKKDSIKSRKLSLISKNSSRASTSKAENKLFDIIYGDEQFLQKYKVQQMSLMQRNSVYRQKKLTLDYKNQWKI